jgi:hypothetical protein
MRAKLAFDRMHRGPLERMLLSHWPPARPRSWTKFAHDPQTAADVAAIRPAVQRGRPLGSYDWVRRTAKRLGLESTLRAPHRPRTTTAPN